jgi:UDP-N-acetylmuramoyl-tripeptide--D-alanyl-D-alanine ligase
VEFGFQELATLTQGVWYTVSPTGPVVMDASSVADRSFSFSIDTRTLQPGDIFVALPGTNSDGHAYLPQALRQGAFGGLVSDEALLTTLRSEALSGTQGIPCLLKVADTLHALQSIARACREKHPVPLLGITGSNGKTTVKDMTSAILERHWQVVKTHKSFNNHIGLPLTLANMTERHEVAVLEMGMNAPGELTHLASLAHPTIGMITNIARAHFGFFHSIEAIMQAKMELIQALPPDGAAVLNADDALFDPMRRQTACPFVTFGLGSAGHQPQISAQSLAVDPSGKFSFELLTPEGSLPIALPLPGRHTVQNALAAAALVYALDQWDRTRNPSAPQHGRFFTFQTIREGLEHFSPSPMRMQMSTHKDVTILNDAYNANPASMAAALHTMHAMACSGKKMAVLGDMRELGEISAVAHREVGQLAAEVPVAKLFLLGEYAGDLAHGALAAGMRSEDIAICASHQELAQAIAAHAAAGDLLLVKASRGVALEKALECYQQLSGLTIDD